jgi:hypothetical protein
MIKILFKPNIYFGTLIETFKNKENKVLVIKAIMLGSRGDNVFFFFFLSFFFFFFIIRGDNVLYRKKKRKKKR